MQDFAINLETHIAEQAPAPKEAPLHAQSQRLQWKVFKKTKQAQALKDRTQPARAALKPLVKQYSVASAQLAELHTQWRQFWADTHRRTLAPEFG